MPHLTDQIMRCVSDPEQRLFLKAEPMGRGAQGLFSPIRRWALFIRAAAVILLAALVCTPFWLGPARETDAVANIMKETQVLLSDITHTFSTAGWAVAAAPKRMADDVKGAWLAMAGNSAEGRLFEAFQQTQAVIPDGVNALTGYLGRFLTRFSQPVRSE